MRLTNRIAALLGGRQAPAGAAAAVPVATATSIPPAPGSQEGPRAEPAVAPAAAAEPVVAPAAGGLPADPPAGGERLDRPGTAAADPVADPCAAPRSAVEDACALSDRMNALALASAERLRDARRAYDEHAGRRERAVATTDPRAIRAAKDEAQAAFRRARIAAVDRAALESAAREWLREIDRINARSREAARVIGREDAAEVGLLQAVERLGVEADGARIAAESAAEACRNARITLASCEETERLGLGRLPSAATLAPASAVARATLVAPPAGPAGEPAAGEAGAAAGLPVQAGEPAILPLLAGDRQVMLRVAAALAEGDTDAERRWQIQLAGFVDAVNARAIDSAVLVFPEEHMFWGPFSQLQCREIAAALAALGYRYDGMGGFADGRVPGQRELSLAIGYAGLDPMRIRFWPNEAELPDLFADVQVDSGRFVAEAAGDLTLGEMIDLLGRRAEELSDLWNAWGRVRPLLLSPA